MCARVMWTSRVSLRTSVCGKQTCIALCLGLVLAGCLSAVGSCVCRPLPACAGVVGLSCLVPASGSPPRSLYPQVHPDSAASGHSGFHLSRLQTHHSSSRSPRLTRPSPFLPPAHLPSIAYGPPAHLPPCCPPKLPNRFLPQGICTCYAHWPGCSSRPHCHLSGLRIMAWHDPPSPDSQPPPAHPQSGSQAPALTSSAS